MGVWARLGEHVKIWDPLFISATIKASNLFASVWLHLHFYILNVLLSCSFEFVQKNKTMMMMMMIQLGLGE